MQLTTLAVVLIVAAVLFVLFLTGGILGARKRDRAVAPRYAEHLAAADQALEAARASDRGWDRAVLQAAAHDALTQSHPGVTFADLHLVLVDDRPGVEEDTAHFEAVGEDRSVRVVLSRTAAGWHGETVS